MRNAIVLHGKPSKEQYFDPSFPSTSNYYWLPWIQKELVVNNIPTNTPEVPNGWVADYVSWKKEFERYDISSDTLLVGHSCGAGFMLRWLSENPQTSPARTILVAPWINPLTTEDTGDFFNFKLDADLQNRTDLRVVCSDNDEPGVIRTVEILQETYEKLRLVELSGYGHFYDERRHIFPELLQLCLE